MHKFCYKKSDMGCPGVCNYKYTLSGKGYPCFSDHSNTDCAWCNKNGWQCEQNSITGPDSKKGSRCQARTNQKYCASQQGDCKHIGYCDPNATCKNKANVSIGGLVTSGESLCRDNCQLIGMSLIGLARQVQKNRD